MILKLLQHRPLPHAAIPGDPTFTADNVMEVMEDQEERWDSLGDLLGVEKRERDRIGYLYQSDPHQKMRAILDHYVRHNRRVSWKRLATALKRMGLSNLADVVTADHVRGMDHRGRSTSR